MLQFVHLYAFLQLILSCLLTRLLIAHIEPIESNLTHHYYIASSSNATMDEEYIICQSTYCHFICNTKLACYDTVINASLSNIAIIECSGSASCEETKIIHGPSEKVIIKCTAQKSCHDAEFHVSNTINVDIQCNDTDAEQWGDEYSACADAKFFASNSINIDIYCNGYGCYQTHFFLENANSANIVMEEYGSRAVEIYASNMSNNLNIDCTKIASCRFMRVSCPFSCSTVQVIWSCRDIGRLDVSKDGGQTFANIKTENNWNNEITHTIHNVSSSTILRITCSNRESKPGFIAIVNCDGDIYSTPKLWDVKSSFDSINNQLIYYPTNWSIFSDYDAEWMWNKESNNTITFQFDFSNIQSVERVATCNIDCTGYYSCDETHVDIKHAAFDNLHVTCNPQIYSSCFPIYFTCTDDTSDMNGATVTRYEWSDERERYQCKDDICCPDNYIYDGLIICEQNVNCTVDCSKEKCIEIDASLAASLYMNCTGDNICLKTIIHTSVLESFHLNCIGFSTCHEMNIYDSIIQNELIYTCNQSACVDVQAEFMLQNDTKVELFCAGFGTELSPSCAYSTFIFNGDSKTNKKGNISLHCQYDSCNAHNNFIFNNVNTVSVYCHQPNACPNITWNNVAESDRNIHCKCNISSWTFAGKHYIVTILGAIIVIVIITLCFWRIYKHQQRKYESEKLFNAKTTIKNPMVIAFVISHNDQQDYDSSINSENIVNKLYQPLKVSFNYDIFPEIANTYWTRQYVLDYLLEKVRQLEDQSHIYDAVIVIIKSIGNEEYIITSDSMTIYKKTVENIFNTHGVRIQSIPRLFVYESTPIINKDSITTSDYGLETDYIMKHCSSSQNSPARLFVCINVYRQQDTAFIHQFIHALTSDSIQPDILKRKHLEHVAKNLLYGKDNKDDFVIQSDDSECHIEIRAEHIILIPIQDEWLQQQNINHINIQPDSVQSDMPKYTLVTTSENESDDESKQSPLSMQRCKSQKQHQTHWMTEHFPKPPINTDHLQKPLSKLTANEISSIIEHWIHNDINYNECICEIQTIFWENGLSGELMTSLQKNAAENMIKTRLLQFMTADTLDIMFKHYECGRGEEIFDTIKNKLPGQLARILYNYPIYKLLKEIKSIQKNGIEVMQQVLNGIVSSTTGWSKQEAYQIESVLLTHQTFTAKQFHAKMRDNPCCVSDAIIDNIRNIMVDDCDVEQLQYDIKNGKNIDDFCNRVETMVDNRVETMVDRDEKENVNPLHNQCDFVKNIYDFIASCFIYEYHDKSLMRREIWTCYYCGNVNFNSVIKKVEKKYPPMCILCGFSHKDSIALKLKKNHTLLTVCDIYNERNEVKEEEKCDDSIIEMINKVIQRGKFDLSCPTKYGPQQCDQIISVARILVKYDKWLKNVSTKHRFNVDTELDLDIEKLHNNFCHITNFHINNENIVIQANTYAFFNRVIHYDTAGNCITSQRFEEIKLQQDNFQNEIYICNIHIKLRHPENRHVSSDIPKWKCHDSKSFRYVTNSCDHDERTYAFGIAHHHPNLEPKYNSIVEELLSSKMKSFIDIQNILLEVTHKYQILLSSNGLLKSTYYNSNFNILRNETMGIRHALSIIIYTNWSIFCTKFRATYKRRNDSMNPHRALYYFARSLFEAVEFFGTAMSAKDFVYHGLDELMYFDKFQTYFNQPISTSDSLRIAHQFSEGTGIILKLKSPIDPMTVPKYLDRNTIRTLSCFPEEEKLFYGTSVQFQIVDIIEASDIKSQHSDELKFLNKFQTTIQNEVVDWNCQDYQQTQTFKSFISLIKNQVNHITFIEAVFDALCQQNEDLDLIYKMRYFFFDEEYDSDISTGFFDIDDSQKKKLDTVYQTVKHDCITPFGVSLFRHFCNSVNTSWICIRNVFELLPPELRNILFVTNNIEEIKLFPFIELFPHLQTLVFNELNLQQMIKDCKHYSNAVVQLVQYIKDKSNDNLIRVSFKSLRQENGRENLAFRNLIISYSNILGENNWSIEYQYQEENIHKLHFRRHI
eukprot:553841_1